MLNCVFTREGGDSNAEDTIIYIHGLGESGLCFENLIKHPALQVYHHLVPDLPGYGKSRKSAKTMDLHQEADFLFHWITSQKKKNIILAGHSMGGVVGLFLCCKYPELIKAFINIEGNISIHDCGFSSRVVGYTEDEFYKTGYRVISDSIYVDGARSKSLRDYYVSFRICDPATLYQNSLNLVEFSNTEKGAEQLSRLPIPVTYILGSPDGTGEYSQKFLKEAGIDIKIIHHAGHWPFIDQEEEFVKAMLSFLKEI